MAIMPEEPAGTIAAVCVGIAAAWKLWLWAKKDYRTDKGGAQQQDSYSDLIEELREELARLSETVKGLGMSLDTEIRLRRAVEDENHELRMRLRHLESVVKQLGGAI